MYPTKDNMKQMLTINYNTFLWINITYIQIRIVKKKKTQMSFNKIQFEYIDGQGGLYISV